METQEHKDGRWREVTGTILHSEVRFDWEFYTPVVRYRYVVDGLSYESDTIAVGMVQYNWRGPAERTVEKYPVGAQVPVYVDKANPRNARLRREPDFNGSILIVFVIALLVLVFAVLATAD